MDHLNLIALKKFPLIEPGDNLNEIILKSISDNNLLLEDGDILIIAQKIISKALFLFLKIDVDFPFLNLSFHKSKSLFSLIL